MRRSGNPLDGAEVVLLEQQRGVRTEANGLFRLDRVPAGPNVVFVRRLAFREVTAFVTVKAGDTADVVVELDMIAHQLAPVLVAASKRLSDRRGRLAAFDQRRRMGIGKFLNREEIEEINTTHLSDVFRRVPGVRLVLSRQGRWVVHMTRSLGMSSSTCKPELYMDGMRFPVVDELGIDMILPAHVEALEVFRGPAEIPAQYNTTNSACGVILVWTKVAG